MLPNPDDLPSRGAQELISFLVPGSISLDLGGPVGLVGLGCNVVLRASMPEAAVQKHCNAGALEHEICPASNVGERRVVHAVTKA